MVIPDGAPAVHGRRSTAISATIEVSGRRGEMAEWFKAAVLKTVEARKGPGGSNPFLSANLRQRAVTIAVCRL